MHDLLQVGPVVHLVIGDSVLDGSSTLGYKTLDTGADRFCPKNAKFTYGFGWKLPGFRYTHI